ncbi:MAG: amino acid adenylation domain-containing protein [Agarilytica sp.]
MDTKHELTVKNLIKRLAELGASLSLEDGKLKLHAKKGSIDGDLQSEIKNNKAAIIELLTKAKGESELPTIKPVDRTQVLPLSYSQQRLWFLDQLEGASATYNIPSAIFLYGEIKEEKIEECIQHIINRHEILRTIYLDTEEGAKQRVLKKADFSLVLDDVSEAYESMAKSDKIIFVHKLAKEYAAQTFDLSSDISLRVKLIKIEDNAYILLLNMHHIASDGWSTGILIEEFVKLYQGGGDALSPLPLQYGDFASWQRQHFDNGTLAQSLDYWKETLAGLDPILSLPFDKPRPAAQQFYGEQVPVKIDSDLADKLRVVAKQYDASLYMLLMAAYQYLLSYYSRSEDIAIGTPVANRNHPQLEALIGFFVNTLVVRSDVNMNSTFSDLMSSVKTQVLDAMAHGQVPFEKIVDHLAPERSLSYQPFFQNMFSLLNKPMEEVKFENFKVEKIELDSGVAKFDLHLSLVESSEGLEGFFEFSTALFERRSIERMLAHYIKILNLVSTFADIPLKDISLLDEEESNLLDRWNENDHAVTFGTVHAFFESQVERNPNVIALSSDEGSMTYRELDFAANRLANHLLENGVSIDSPVGLSLKRSNDMIIAMLGILKSGACYVALDPNYPIARLQAMVEDSGLGYLVTDTESHEKITPCLDKHIQKNTILMNLDETPAWAGCPDTRPDLSIHKLCAAYVTFTSGSTGRPKGSLVTHGGLANLLQWQIERYPINEGEVCCQYTTINFDVSFQEIFGTLSCGGTLVIASEKERHDPALLVSLLNKEKVSYLFCPVVVLQQLAEYCRHVNTIPKSLRVVTTAGDALRVTKEVEHLFDRLPKAELHNHYGPSETHVVTASHFKPEAKPWPKLPHIGKAVSNCRLYVVDQNLQRVPVGVAGELLIGGDQLFRAYCGRPIHTAEVCIPDAYSGRGGQRLYRTGDLVRFLDNGDVQYLGRIDEQVKIRGFRVELGEIENVFASNEWVSNVVIVARTNERSNEKYLVAYLVLNHQEEDSTTEQLKVYIAKKLPDYMRPSHLVYLNEIPKTKNGKIDRTALPAPRQIEEVFRPPETEMEAYVISLYEHVLDVTNIGRDGHFFDLGGHSLKATKLVTRLREELVGEFSVQMVFEYPRVYDLARLIDGSPKKQHIKIESIARDRDIPLSYPQQRLWFLNQLEGSDSITYSMPMALHVEGNLDPGLVKRTLDCLVARHEILRTSFSDRNGVAVQVIHDYLEPEVRYLKLQSENNRGLDYEIRNVVEKEINTPFNLARGPLLRVSILSLDEGACVFIFNMHHIISDGWSINNLCQEFCAIYAASQTGSDALLDDITIHYADFSVWQRQWLESDDAKGQLDYWAAYLKGLPECINLPLDHSRPPVQSYRGKRVEINIDKALKESLERFSKENNVSLFMTLISAFSVLIYRWSDQKDISIGSALAGRTRSELEPLIGFFANLWVLRADLSGGVSFNDLLAQVKSDTLRAYSNQMLPFDMVVDALKPDRSLAYSPIFQIMFLLHNNESSSFKLEGLSAKSIDVDFDIAKHDLTVNLWPSDDGIVGSFEYSVDLFEDGSIVDLVSSFHSLLGQIVSENPQSVDDYELGFSRASLGSGSVLPLKGLTQFFQAHGATSCAVLENNRAAGVELSAYVASASDPQLQELNVSLQKNLPSILQPVSLVPVSHIPLTKNGAVDESKLRAIHHLSEQEILKANARLEQDFPDKQARYSLMEVSSSSSSLHLADITPGWRWLAHGSVVDDVLTKAEVNTRTDNVLTRPDAYVNGGSLEGSDTPVTLVEALQNTALHFPDKGITFVLANNECKFLSYSALSTEAQAALYGLQQKGLKQGDAVILQLENTYAHLVSFWACVLGGFRPVTVAIAPSYSQKNGVADKLFNIWTLLDSPLVLTNESLEKSLGGMPELYEMFNFQLATFESLICKGELGDIYPAKPEDVVFYQLTSGSTGVPKCIQETHRGIISHILGSSKYCNYSTDDRSMNWLPMDHVVPILTFHLKDTFLGIDQLEVATSLVLHDPLLWLDLIEEFSITHSWSPNFGYKLVAEALSEDNSRSRNLSSIKILMNAGEQVTLPVVKKFLALVAPFGVSEQVMQPSFGMAEACTCMTYQNGFSAETGVRYFKKSSLQSDLVETNAQDKSGIGFIDLGGTIPGVEIRIADENNTLIREGQIGRFQIRGSVITPGYYLNDEANKAAFVGDGWFDSGDLGFILDGRLTLTGRAKETIIVNGANFYCYEIEDVVNSVDGVIPTFSAAVSVDDEESGTENLLIFFCPEEAGAVSADTISRIKGEVTRALGVSPAYVIPIDTKAFPKTTSGKIQRVQLKKALLAGEYAARLREIDLVLNSPDVIPSWFYQERWVKKTLEFKGGVSHPGTYLVFNDNSHDLTALITRLRSQGRDVVEVVKGENYQRLNEVSFSLNPNNLEDFRCLINDLCRSHLAPTTVVYTWYACREIVAKDHKAYLDIALKQGVYVLKALLSALISSTQNQEEPRFFITASDALSHSAHEASDYASGYLQGWLSSVNAELGNLQTALVSVSESERKNISSILQGELSQVFIEDVCYHENKRYCQRFETALLDNTGSYRGPRPEGFYLVSGGLGGIGSLVCQWLLKEYRVRLLILGRSELVPGSEKYESFASMKKISNDIVYVQADLNNCETLENLVNDQAQAWGCSLDGVFHLAGIYNESMLHDETQYEVDVAVDAKVMAAFNLFNLLVKHRERAKSREPALFVNMSSALSYFPAAGISTYSATNAFLNSFTQYQNQDHGVALESYALVSSNWDAIGMSSDIPFKKAVEQRGFHFMRPDHALASIRSILSQKPGVWMFGIDMSKPALRSRLVDQPAEVLKPYLFVQTPTSSQVLNDVSSAHADRFGKAIHIDACSVDKLPTIVNGVVKEEAGASAQISGAGTSIKMEPKSNVERKLVDLWKDVLNLENLGTNENFFELGGNSILAVNLLGMINQKFSQEINLAKLFHAQTIVDLAIVIEEEQGDLWNPIVTLNSKGDKAPLFLVHPGGGWVTNYQLLTSLLDDDQPVFGVQARGIIPGLRSHQTIEEMSSAYADAINEAMKESNQNVCSIGGWSLGAVIAFETAKQLQERGITLENLFLIDSAPHPFDEDEIKILDEYDDVDMLAHLSETLLSQKDMLNSLSPDERLNYTYQHLLDEGEVPPGTGVEHLESLRDEALANAQIRRKGVSDSMIENVKMLLIISSEVNARSHGLEYLGWGKYVKGKINVFDVNGKHENLMASPCVEKIASAINRVISDGNHTI